MAQCLDEHGDNFVFSFLHLKIHRVGYKRMKNSWSRTGFNPDAPRSRDDVNFVSLLSVRLCFLLCLFSYSTSFLFFLSLSFLLLGFNFRRGLGIFLFTTVSGTVLKPTQSPFQWLPGALSLRVKRPGREADHSSPSSAEVKNAGSYTSTPQYVFMAWCLVKHRDNFTFLRFTD
jgi:hypothetical protein